MLPIPFRRERNMLPLLEILLVDRETAVDLVKALLDSYTEVLVPKDKVKSSRGFFVWGSIE